MAHHIQIGAREQKFCTLCGVTSFEEGCKFTIESNKVEAENKKLEIEVENKKIDVEAENKKIEFEIEKEKIKVEKEIEKEKLIYGNIYLNIWVSFILFFV